MTHDTPQPNDNHHQVNHFSPKPGQPDVMVADVQFRMPRPR